MRDVVVVGAGLSGLVASLRLRRAGLRTALVHMGRGGLQLGQGTIDVLGYRPARVERPLDELGAFCASTEDEGGPTHPYAVLGADGIRAGVAWLRELVGESLLGDVETNTTLPTALGGLRPTALYPPSMAAGAVSLDPAAPGALHGGSSVVVVGIDQLKDFSPRLVAENLAVVGLPDGGLLTTRSASISFPGRGTEADSNAVNIARALDRPGRRGEFIAALRTVSRRGETVAVPNVLGLDPATFRAVADGLDRPLFEIPLPPPGVAGLRLNDLLTDLAKAARVELIGGSRVTGARTGEGRVRSLLLGTAGHETALEARAFLLAPGGFESGALELDSHGVLHERILGLPLAVPDGELLNDAWAGRQPIFRVGVAADAAMRVVEPSTGRPVHENLHAAGGILAGAQRWDEKSGEGIALASAVRAADSIIESLKESA